jgi:hypothetical protein
VGCAAGDGGAGTGTAAVAGTDTAAAPAPDAGVAGGLALVVDAAEGCGAAGAGIADGADTAAAPLVDGMDTAAAPELLTAAAAPSRAFWACAMPA